MREIRNVITILWLILLGSSGLNSGCTDRYSPYGKWCLDKFNFGLKNDCKTFIVFQKDSTILMYVESQNPSIKGRYRYAGRNGEIVLETGMNWTFYFEDKNNISITTPNRKNRYYKTSD